VGRAVQYQELVNKIHLPRYPEQGDKSLVEIPLCHKKLLREAITKSIPIMRMCKFKKI